MNGPPIVTDGSVTWSGPVLDSWSCTDSPGCRRVQYRAGDLFQGRDTLVVELAESEDLTVAMWLMDWDTDGQSSRICDGEGVWTSDDLVTWQNLDDAPGIVLSCKGGQAGSELAWLNYELEIQDLGP